MAFIATPESIAALGLTRLRPRTLQMHHFWMMIAAAAAIHALILLIVEMWPSSEPEFTPRAIQMRLGGGRPMASVPSAAQTSPRENTVAIAMPRPKPKPLAVRTAPTTPAPVVQAKVPAPAPAKPASKPAPKPAPKPIAMKPATTLTPLPPASERKRPAQNPTASTASAIPTGSPLSLPKSQPQQPTELAPMPQLAALSNSKPSVGISGGNGSGTKVHAPAGPGVPDGSPEAKLIRARYEQVVSQWLQKYQVYPAAAKMLGQQGQPVLRIRMDRGGDVKFSGVDKSSGYRLIDDAALAMVKRASPFPRPPENYPGQEKMIEFLVPVAFRIN